MTARQFFEVAQQRAAPNGARDNHRAGRIHGMQLKDVLCEIETDTGDHPGTMMPPGAPPTPSP